MIRIAFRGEFTNLRPSTSEKPDAAPNQNKATRLFFLRFGLGCFSVVEFDFLVVSQFLCPDGSKLFNRSDWLMELQNIFSGKTLGLSRSGEFNFLGIDSI